MSTSIFSGVGDLPCFATFISMMIPNLPKFSLYLLKYRIRVEPKGVYIQLPIDLTLMYVYTLSL